MYQGKRKNKRWTIEEKNEIVFLYLDGHMGRTEILRTFDIKSDAIFHKWVEQYRQFGTCVDNLGKCSKAWFKRKQRERLSQAKS